MIIANLLHTLRKDANRFFIKLYIYSKAKKSKLSNYDDVDSVLNKYENNLNIEQINFSFYFLYDTFTESESMCITKHNKILANPAWAAKMVLFYSTKVEKVFFITVGHEITHIEKEFSFKCLHAEERKFVRWTNEIHADFGAAEKMANSNRHELLEVIDYKINQKLYNKDSNSHPSWKHRKGYVENYDFDINLINKIANDTDCINKELIEDICDHYQPIYLI